ncbi:Uncharacterised protein [Bordetella pertussis]|nr:Uncharacterised protein [Bordetella pertussis]
MQDAMHALAGGVDDFRNILRARKLAHDMRGRIQLFDFTDTKVIGIVRHGTAPGVARQTDGKKKAASYAGGFFGDSLPNFS